MNFVNKKELDAIYDAVYKTKNIDWNQVTELVRNLTDINGFVDNEDSTLSYFFDSWLDTRKAVELTKLFLENGFDVNGNDGFNGTSCLKKLCWLGYHGYILDVAELLLDAGSKWDYIDPADDEKYTVLDEVGGRTIEWGVGDFDSANLYEAYYLMVKRYSESKPYKEIRMVSSCKGQIITKVERISYKECRPEADIWDIKDALIVWCGNSPVVINESVDIFVNPYVYESAVEIEDLSERYKDIIGERIKNIYFKDTNCARLYAEKHYLFISSDYMHGPNRTHTTRSLVCSTGRKEYFYKGQHIDKVSFETAFTYAPGLKEYSMYHFYLSTDDELFHISGTGRMERLRALLVDRIPDDLGKKLTRRIDATNIYVEELGYNDKGNLSYMILKGSKGYIYIIPNEFYEVCLYFSLDLCKNPYDEEAMSAIRYVPIMLWDKQKFNSLRLLTSRHKGWNEIELYVLDEILKYRMNWREDINDKGIIGAEEPHISGVVVNDSKVPLDIFWKRLKEIGFDDWFEPHNTRSSKHNEITWRLFYDDSMGVFKERDHLDNPVISEEAFSKLIDLLEDVVGLLEL